ncbi:MAG TPA: hypothetical protein VLA12_12445, partial [Planctomycetaceae bacterium]|nr:hypothetical protein [Planctomycetaceae bacterium]
QLKRISLLIGLMMTGVIGGCYFSFPTSYGSYDHGHEFEENAILLVPISAFLGAFAYWIVSMKRADKQ